MNSVKDEILMHYGMPRRSGRYPYGSGKDPYQRNNRDFLARIDELKKSGWTETAENIKKEFGMTTNQYRSEKANAKNDRFRYNIAKAKSMREDGKGWTEIGRKLGESESTVRGWFNENAETRRNAARKAADHIKAEVLKKGMVDVGANVEIHLGISKEKMKQALDLLQEEGFPLYKRRVNQVTNPNSAQKTTLQVLCKPGTEYKEIYDSSKIQSLMDYTSHDGGETFDRFMYPESLDSKRVMVRYKEDGGIDRDGIIELRRNVPDLDLGGARYSQVRVLVDGTHYLKGMAVYSDDMPDGVDVIFNTNKTKDVAKMDVFKKIKDDPENPFGTTIKPGGQSYYVDKDGNRKLSVINKKSDEGDWSEWKDSLPSQFLSKQSLSLAKKQLGLAAKDKYDEFDEICALTNPTIKKHLLEKFADSCDSAAVHLKAKALPHQKYHVIIPINTLTEKEVYAPNYEDGTKLALIRYPHGGTFEIPILTVNNKHAPAKKLLGTDIPDAIGINAKVAERLSGADFDGDTVMCIPTHDPQGRVRITSTDPLEGLVDFDPKVKYGSTKVKDADGKEHYYRNGVEFKPMTKSQTQMEMGKVSNLITDMTLQKAPMEKMAAAVRHSMVVIDAEKHKLDFKASEIDNNISALKKEYQTGGASTLISRASSPIRVTKRQGTGHTNMPGSPWYDPTRPEGAKIYRDADDAYYEKTRVNKRTGEIKTTIERRTQDSKKMAETDDAFTLVSEANTPMERAYATYANQMKSLANQARKTKMTTGKIAFSKTAKTIYQAEVDELERKLREAELNAPRERLAQLKANAEIDAKVAAAKAAGRPMTKSEVKKASQQAALKYRSAVGTKTRSDRNIKITDREWEAIQAGAISEAKLERILKNTDIDSLRERATPRATTTVSPAKISKIQHMRNQGATLAEIARATGVSTATVSSYLN
jgi:hypothetical protein